MKAVQVAFQIPEYIAQGLSSGAYERVGGVVREAGSKQVVAWLREANEMGAPLLSNVLSASPVGAVSSVLNLAVSTTGFVVVLKRLGVIERQLEQAQEVLEAIDYKIDLSFYANFRAALDLAMNAFTLTNAENRNMSAMQAINRLLEAEHQYARLAKVEINQGSLVAYQHLTTLCLAYVTEARCYLELEEVGMARSRLIEGVKVAHPLFKQLIETLLTSNPAAYLHPSLREYIGMKRLTRLYRWIQPGIKLEDLVEMQLDKMFDFAQAPEEWVDSLPQAIRMSNLGTVRLENDEEDELDDEEESNVGFFDILSSIFEEEFPVEKAIRRLPAIMDLIETMIEDEIRFVMYLEEIKAMRQLGMSFQEWRQLAPASTAQGNGSDLIYITVA
jgi:hypothetical protein